MKKLKQFSFRNTFLLLVLFYLIPTINGYSQEKKDVSLAIQYIKLINENSSINISAKYKDESGFEPCKGVIFSVYIGDDADEKLGELKTNKLGKGKFIIPNESIRPTTTYTVKLENNKTFEDVEESITITDVSIEASIEKTEEGHSITAKLVSSDNEPIAEESLNVGLKRLFGNMPLGEEDSYTTDEDGTVEVEIDKGLTGINGKLNFQVVINESETYGTVIANLYGDFGVPIVDKSTFNQRTMWSPPSKTPIFLLIVPNIIIISIWSILFFLILNLFKIYKSKN